METRAKVILVGIALLIVAFAFNCHLYLFDRPEYLACKSAEKCAAAEMANSDYHECRTVGYRDERCSHFRAIYIEKLGACEAARDALDAEAYRRRAR